MKKIINVLLALFLVFSLVAFVADEAFAYQPQYTDKADLLNTFGLFQGKGDARGYDLASSLTRAEAATMIVRLLGMEHQAEAHAHLSYFPDVPANAWHAGYVNYCRLNNILQGYPDGTYRPDTQINTQEFLTLMLAILDYKINVDYTWENTFIQSTVAGLIPRLTSAQYQAKTTFLRDDMVFIAHNALVNKLNNSTETLLEKLVNEEVVSRALAINEGYLDNTDPISIEKTEVTGVSTITVTLNQPIDANRLSVSSFVVHNEDLTDVVDILELSYDQDLRVLSIITEQMMTETEYTVVFDELYSVDGVVTKDLLATFKTAATTTPKPVIKDIPYLGITHIESLDEKTLLIHYSREVNLTAEFPLYYSIFEGDTRFVNNSFTDLSLKVNPANNKSVYLYLKNKSFAPGTNYRLEVQGTVTDIYNTTLGYDTNKESMSFIASGGEPEILWIQQASATNNRTIEITFNKPVSRQAAINKLNYQLYSNQFSNQVPMVISEVVLSSDGKTVYIIPSSMLSANYIYTVKISRLPSLLEETRLNDKGFDSITSSDQGYIEVVGSNVSASELEAIAVNTMDTRSVLIFFNKPIDKATAETAGNYLFNSTSDGLFNLSSPTKVYYVDEFTARAYLPANREFRSDHTYSLQLQSGLKDFQGHTALTTTTRTFSGTNFESPGPVLTGASTLSKQHVLLTFNEDIDYYSTSTIHYTLAYGTDSDADIHPSSISRGPNSSTLVLYFNTPLRTGEGYTLTLTPNITIRNALEMYMGSNFNRTGFTGM